MKNICLIFCGIVFLLSSCHSLTNREIINETSHKVVEAIKKKNQSDFKNLIGVSNLEVIGKDEESIRNDVNRYNQLFIQALKNNGELPIDITGLFNDLGQTVVRIKLQQSLTDSSGVKSLHLNLYFGPPQIIPLKKISGYELIENNSDSTEFKKNN